MDIVEIEQYVWVYRQPGGCVEIGQWEDDRKRDQDLIHICDKSALDQLISVLQEMRDK